MITVVDYGTGNLGSIRNMLRKIGADCVVTGDPAKVATADKLILPGVGAFDAGMDRLCRDGLREALDQRVLRDGVPILGICLGMQLMTRGSREGDRPGLGWLDADVLRFEPSAAAPKVPHMGWNLAQRSRPDSLLEGMDGELRFYFVHSYYVRCEQAQDQIIGTTYGTEFTSGFCRDNVRGVQFHPEKSHRFGMQLLSNFVERC